jgi:hypothetical protein
MISLHILLFALPVTSSYLRLATWNLCYDSKPDNISVNDTISSLPPLFPTDDKISFYSNASETAWSSRRIGVANEILFSRADIFCAQEALLRQVTDLEQLLGSEYARIGVGRDDGLTSGEYAAIYYRTSAVSLRDWDTGVAKQYPILT